MSDEIKKTVESEVTGGERDIQVPAPREHTFEEPATMPIEEEVPVQAPVEAGDVLMDENPYSYEAHTELDFSYAEQDTKLQARDTIRNLGATAALGTDDPIGTLQSIMQEYDMEGDSYTLEMLRDSNANSVVEDNKLVVGEILLEDSIADEDKIEIAQGALSPRDTIQMGDSVVTLNTKPTASVAGKAIIQAVEYPSFGETKRSNFQRSAVAEALNVMVKRQDEQQRLLNSMVKDNQTTGLGAFVDVFSEIAQEVFPVIKAGEMQQLVAEAQKFNPDAEVQLWALIGSNISQIKDSVKTMNHDDQMAFFKAMYEAKKKQSGIFTENEYETFTFMQKLMEQPYVTQSGDFVERYGPDSSDKILDNIFAVAGIADFAYMALRSFRTFKETGRPMTLGFRTPAERRALREAAEHQDAEQLQRVTSQIMDETIDPNLVNPTRQAQINDAMATLEESGALTVPHQTASSRTVTAHRTEDTIRADNARVANIISGGDPVRAAALEAEMNARIITQPSQASLVRTQEITGSLRRRSTVRAPREVGEGTVLAPSAIDEATVTNTRGIVGQAQPASVGNRLPVANPSLSNSMIGTAIVDDTMAGAYAGVGAVDISFTRRMPEMNTGTSGFDNAGGIPLRGEVNPRPNIKSQEIANWVDESSGINFKPEEVAAGVSNVKATIAKNFGKEDTAIHYTTSTITADGDVMDIYSVYGRTKDQGFGTYEEALHSIDAVVNDFPRSGDNFSVAVVVGDEFIDVSARVADGTMTDDVADMVMEATTNGNASYYVVWNEKTTLKVHELGNEDWADFMMRGTLLDRAPVLQGGGTGNILDFASYGDPAVYQAAIRLEQKDAALQRVFTDYQKQLTKQAKQLRKEGGAREVEEYLTKANNEGWMITQPESRLAMQNFSEAQTEYVKTFRNFWDDMWHVQNSAIGRSLDNKGFQRIEFLKTGIDAGNNQVDLLLYGKPLSTSKAKSGGILPSPKIGETSELPFVNIDDYINNPSDHTRFISRMSKNSDGEVTGIPSNVDESTHSMYELNRPLEITDTNGEIVASITHAWGPRNLTRRIDKTDSLLEYRAGYYTRYYKDPNFVMKRTLNKNGKVIKEEAVYSSPTRLQAESYADEMLAARSADEEGNTFEYMVRDDIKDPNLQLRMYNQAGTSSSRTSHKFRGKKLGSPLDDNQAMMGGDIASPTEAVQRGISDTSGIGDMGAFFDTVEARWLNQYKRHTVDGAWPRGIDEIGEAGYQTTKEVADAKASYTYIQQLKHLEMSNVDKGVKQVYHNMAKILGQVVAGGAEAGTKRYKAGVLAEKGVRALQEAPIIGAPVQSLKSIAATFQLAFNPLRRWAVGFVDWNRIAGMHPLAAIEATPDLVMALKYKTSDAFTDTVLRNEGASSVYAKQALIDFENLGITANLDRNYLIESGIADSYSGLNNIASNAFNKLSSGARKIGQNPAEWMQHFVPYMVMRQARHGKKVKLTNAELERLAADVSDFNFSPTRAGNLRYNRGVAGLIMQYAHIMHKGLTQVVPRGSTKLGLGFRDKGDVAKAIKQMSKASAPIKNLRNSTRYEGFENLFTTKFDKKDIKGARARLEERKALLSEDISIADSSIGSRAGQKVARLEKEMARTDARLAELDIAGVGNTQLSNKDKLGLAVYGTLLVGTPAVYFDKYIDALSVNEDVKVALKNGLGNLLFSKTIGVTAEMSDSVQTNLEPIVAAMARMNEDGFVAQGSHMVSNIPAAGVTGRFMKAFDEAYLYFRAPDYREYMRENGGIEWYNEVATLGAITLQPLSGVTNFVRAMQVWEHKKLMSSSGLVIANEVNAVQGLLKAFGFKSIEEVNTLVGSRDLGSVRKDYEAAIEDHYKLVKGLMIAEGMPINERDFKLRSAKMLFIDPEFNTPWARQKISSLIINDWRSGDQRLQRVLVENFNYLMSEENINQYIDMVQDEQMRESIRLMYKEVKDYKTEIGSNTDG